MHPRGIPQAIYLWAASVGCQNASIWQMQRHILVQSTPNGCFLGQVTSRLTVQATPPPLQLLQLPPLAAAATCWTGAGAITTTTMGMTIATAGAAGMAAAMMVTTMVGALSLLCCKCCK